MTGQVVRSKLKPVVIDPEQLMQPWSDVYDHVVFRTEISSKDTLRDKFLILPSSLLDSYADFLAQSAKTLTKLRTVFIWMDTDFDAFFDKLADIRSTSTLSKMLRFSKDEQVFRVLDAWSDGAQAIRFAEARVEGHNLVTKTCDLTKYQINLADLPVLREISSRKLEKAELDRYGERIVWKKLKIDLDFDTVRYHADPKYKLQTDVAALEFYRHYGVAFRRLREQKNLTQEVISDAIDVSTRHLSRIENGEQRLTVKLMDKLAAVHGLTLDDYLSQLLQICDSMESQLLRAGK